MTLLILFFLLSIGFSFLCSVLEAVLLSITPSFIRTENAKGTTAGKLFSAYKEDIDRPLSAILTLNTIAHTVGAIGVGAQAGKVFGETTLHLGPITIGAEALVAGIMTLAILILSEIIPKTIGANYWRRLAPFTANTLRVLMFLLYPLVWLSQLITKSLKNDKNKSVLSRGDFASMTQAGAESGALNEREHTIIKNLLSFEALPIKSIMTPKRVMFMLEEDSTLEELTKEENFNTFSRVPIYNDTRDNITGFVLKDRALQMLIEGKKDETLKSIKRPVEFVRETTPLNDLFKIFTKERHHIAVVTDEFGDVLGVVTMEDLFETLIGLEILDETDQVADLQEYARQQWKKRMDRQKNG
jgi:CBS domain containing-hemolysin-like protein